MDPIADNCCFARRLLDDLQRHAPPRVCIYSWARNHRFGFRLVTRTRKGDRRQQLGKHKSGCRWSRFATCSATEFSQWNIRFDFGDVHRAVFTLWSPNYIVSNRNASTGTDRAIVPEPRDSRHLRAVNGSASNYGSGNRIVEQNFSRGSREYVRADFIAQRLAPLGFQVYYTRRRSNVKRLTSSYIRRWSVRTWTSIPAARAHGRRFDQGDRRRRARADRRTNSEEVEGWSAIFAARGYSFTPNNLKQRRAFPKAPSFCRTNSAPPPLYHEREDKTAILCRASRGSFPHVSKPRDAISSAWRQLALHARLRIFGNGESYRHL